MDYKQLSQDMIENWSIETYGDSMDPENTRPNGLHPDDELLVFRHVVEGIIVDGIKKTKEQVLLDFLTWLTKKRDPKILGFQEDSYSPHDQFYLGEPSDLVEEYLNRQLLPIHQEDKVIGQMDTEIKDEQNHSST